VRAEPSKALLLAVTRGCNRQAPPYLPRKARKPSRPSTAIGNKRRMFVCKGPHVPGAQTHARSDLIKGKRKERPQDAGWRNFLLRRPTKSYFLCLPAVSSHRIRQSAVPHHGWVSAFDRWSRPCLPCWAEKETMLHVAAMPPEVPASDTLT